MMPSASWVRKIQVVDIDPKFTRKVVFGVFGLVVVVFCG